MSLKVAEQSYAENVELRALTIADVRRDGETQCRSMLRQSIIKEYATTYAAGATLPPITVWFDGSDYWLSDGFQRLAAAEMAQRDTILAEIHLGSLSDAQWDSYNANSAHGLRRTKADLALTVARALRHANASKLSSNQLAKHLGIPEATLRRLRAAVSSPNDEDQNRVRVVTRNGKTYEMKTSAIGHRDATRHKRKSLKMLAIELDDMRRGASAEVMPLINILNHWLFGSAGAHDCLLAIERLNRSRNIVTDRGVRSQTG